MTESYDLVKFKEDWKEMYHTAAVKGDGVCFLITDSQLRNERYCEYLNDFLDSGNIPDLFSRSEREALVAAIQPQVSLSMGYVSFASHLQI